MVTSDVSVRIPQRFRTRAILAIALLCAFSSFIPRASAQSLPMFVKTAQPVLDEFGQRLQGHPTLSAAQCDRVEIRLAQGGAIDAPSPDGQASANNPLVDGGLTSIGSQLADYNPQPAEFSASLPAPLPAGTKFFVRIFNAPTTEEATFYGDSQLFTASNDFTHVYSALVTNMLPLDPADDDADGLNNSWEQSLASDADRPDTDGDGMTDGDEFRAGTDLLDQTAFFALGDVIQDDLGNVTLHWPAVPGRTYQAEIAQQGDLATATFEPLGGPYVATDTAGVLNFLNAITNETAYFRIRLVDE